jgi:hypothetical protein
MQLKEIKSVCCHFDVTNHIVLGNKLINRNGRLTQLWFQTYIAVCQQSASCFDRSCGRLQAVIFTSM